MVKEYGRREINSIQVLILVSVCALFFLLVFSFFRGLFIISLDDFFVEAYPFKNIYQMEIFYQKGVY